MQLLNVSKRVGEELFERLDALPESLRLRTPRCAAHRAIPRAERLVEEAVLTFCCLDLRLPLRAHALHRLFLGRHGFSQPLRLEKVRHALGVRAGA